MTATTTKVKDVEDAVFSTAPQPNHPLTASPEKQRNGTPHLGCAALAGALAAAQQKCKAAEKDSVNTFHRYKYASAEAIITEAKAALADTGLSLIPLEQTLDVTPAPRSSDPKLQEPDRYELRRKFLLLHTSGESIPLLSCWPVMPEKGRPVDKATAIACTGSLAYLLRDLLLMPRVNAEDDLPARQDRPAPPQQQQAPAPPMQENSSPNPPAPAPTPEPGHLTEQEDRDLQTLARASKRTVADVQAILKVVGVPVLAKVPRNKLEWVRQALTTGLTPQAQVDRIAGLVNLLGLDWTTFRTRLTAVYGTSSLGQLLPSQAAEVEAKLQGLPKPQQPQPTPAA